MVSTARYAWMHAVKLKQPYKYDGQYRATWPGGDDAGSLWRQDKGQGRHRLNAQAHRKYAYGYYLWRMAKRGVAGIAASHCVPMVAAFGAGEKMLGTNPLAFGFPGASKDDDPVLIDLATSAVSWSEVDRRRRAGETLD